MACTRRSLLLVFGTLLDRGTVYNLFVPRMEMRVLLCQIRRVALRIRQQARHVPIPWHKRQVGKGALLAHQVWRALLLQVAVDHAEHALDFVGVAVDGGGDALFGVKEGEPGLLAKVGALT